MASGQEIIEAARKFLGAHYQSQGRSRADGLDCGGLILVVARELGISQLEVLGYANAPNGEDFERHLQENAIEITPKENAQIGDILAFDYADGIQHTAFVTELLPRLKVIHAKRPRDGYGSNDRGVIETYLHGADLRAWAKTYRIAE